LRWLATIGATAQTAVIRIRAAAARPALKRLDYQQRCQAGARDNTRPSGSIVITGRLNAIFGDAAFPTVCAERR
jgi:hypothetical protein